MEIYHSSLYVQVVLTCSSSVYSINFVVKRTIEDSLGLENGDLDAQHATVRDILGRLLQASFLFYFFNTSYNYVLLALSIN